MKVINRQDGITLIALVITIIVLLILAGVAISMLSGENGILNQAANAKQKSEAAQAEESLVLADYEVKMDFANAKKDCPINNGVMIKDVIDAELSNDDSDYDVESIYAVGDIKKRLIDGYDIYDKNGNDKLDDNDSAYTGMMIKKGDTEVGRVIIAGDVNGDGDVGADDAVEIKRYINYMDSKITEDYQKVAANLYDDGELNTKDADMISKWCVSLIDDLKISSTNGKKLKRNYKLAQEYKNSIQADSPYKIDYNEENDTYTLKGVTKGTTVAEVKRYLPEGSIIAKTGDDSQSDDDCIVTNQHRIKAKFLYEQGMINDSYISFAGIEVR